MGGAGMFAATYQADPYRGYGYGMTVLLPRLAEDPGLWDVHAGALFEGQGSLGGTPAPDPRSFLEHAARAVPGPVGDGIDRAASLKPGIPAWKAADLLGNGQRIRASDTVPFALWSAAYHLDDLPGALWTTAEGLGDVDTTCAITAGVVAARTGLAGVPPQWLDLCEPLPDWTDALAST